MLFSFSETQVEKMTKSMTIANEQISSSEIMSTPQQQKDLLTILTEIAETSSTTTPLIISEDLQTNLSTETKEISTKIYSNIKKIHII